jgi:formylglycine-generating enzyme required for sulfatase activity
MNGNVWEWTRSLWAAYPYPSERVARIKREALKAPVEEFRVLRGGVFWVDPQNVRCAYRKKYVARHVDDLIGFRVVLAGPP